MEIGKGIVIHVKKQLVQQDTIFIHDLQTALIVILSMADLQGDMAAITHGGSAIFAKLGD